MYLKNIVIKNIGPIDELIVELPFDKKGNPKPIIFVGENGSGKTILQSQIVDSFYEIGSDLFKDIGKREGLSRSYYKISGGLNLQTGKEKGFSALIFIDDGKNIIEYLDKIGDVKKEDIVKLSSDFSLSPDDKNDNQKIISSISEPQKEKLQNEWLTGAHFYQPAYRYEEPFWKNDPFLDFQRFEDKKRFSNQLKKEIEIVSATKANKSFLLDLVLDRYVQDVNPVNIILWEGINNILRRILKKETARLGIGPRGNYRVSIMEDLVDKKSKQIMPSIDSLSLGESILLNLFVNIIRQSGNNSQSFDQIQGIVAIDEIDVHLHTDLQNLVLPGLIKLFPKVQFVITTHSPLFLLGMKKIFGDECFEIRNMPNGEIITTERFSEFGKAYQVLKETEKFEEEIKKEVERSAKPILFVEGDYDIKYINKAAELLDKKDVLKQIQVFDANGYGGLDKIWANYNSKLSEVVPQKILLLYDCDTNKTENQKGKVFKRIVSSIDINLIKKGIENLFPDNTIEKAKEYKKAFFDYTPVITKTVRGIDHVEIEKYEVNKDEKNNLCTWICENGIKNDFSNFSGIIEIIENILIPKIDEN